MKFHWKIHVRVSTGKKPAGVREASVKVVDIHLPPARGVTPDDARLLGTGQVGFEGSFLPAATRYQQHLKRFVVSMIAGFILVAVAVALPGNRGMGFGIFGTGFIVLALVLFFTLPALTCPACGKAADFPLDRFCPECGFAGLQKRSGSGAHCDGCGRNPGTGKYRNFRVRHCTHCGVLLSPGGV